MSLLPEFIQPILESPWALVLLPIMFWFYINYKSLTSYKDHPESFQQALALLKEDRFGKFYRILLGKVLDKVGGWLGDKERFKPRLIFQEDQGHKVVAYNRFFSINPFSPQSYEFILRLAFIYPILSFLLVWVWGGNGSLLGNLSTVATEQRWLVLLLVFFTPVIFLLWILKDKLLTQWLWLMALSALAISFGFTEEIGSFWSVFLWIFILCYIQGGAVGWLIHGNQIVAHQTIYRFAFAFAFAFSAATTDATNAAFAFAVAVAVAVVGAVAIVGAVAVAVVGVVTNGVTVAFIIAIAGIAFVILNKLQKNSENKQLNYLFWLIYSIILLVLGLLVIPTTDNPNGISFFLFFLILPLINAPLDWLSLGITRGLLHSIYHQHHGGLQAFAWALFDVVLAVLFLFAVSALLVVTIGIVDNMSDKTFLCDGLDALNNPKTAKEYYWVHAMLLTTLIPTLVHFAIAGASLTLWLPQQWRHRIATNLEKNHYKVWAASFYLTFTPIIGLLAPFALLYGLYLLVTAHGGWLGGVLLDWANLLAGVIV